ncbi:MAG: methyltransferase domain-containing protein [Gammaproteobacteria bacterium]
MTQIVLHVGCGPADIRHLPELFQRGWREIRLDVDPAVNPDIVADITAMRPVADESVDAVYSSHNLEHLYAHQVLQALGEFHRVLKPGGMLLVTLPDLQTVATAVSQDRLEDPLYQSPVGPITALDVLYGHRPALAQGRHFMAHKTGFTATTLRRKLEAAGFQIHSVNRQDYALWAVAHKPKPA